MNRLKTGQLVTIRGGYKGKFIGYTTRGLEVRALEGLNPSCPHNGVHTYQREHISPFVKYIRKRKLHTKPQNPSQTTTADHLINAYQLANLYGKSSNTIIGEI